MAMPLMEVHVPIVPAGLADAAGAGVARHPGALKKTIFELQARTGIDASKTPFDQLADWMRCCG